VIIVPGAIKTKFIKNSGMGETKYVKADSPYAHSQSE
jgi:hypothetical protein